MRLRHVKGIEEKIERAYMDRLDNKISIDIYKNISSKLIEDKENIEKQYNELKETYNEFMSKNSDERLIEAEEVAEEFIKSRKKVSRDLIVKLIDKIEFTKDKQISSDIPYAAHAHLNRFTPDYPDPALTCIHIKIIVFQYCIRAGHYLYTAGISIRSDYYFISIPLYR